MANKDTPPAGQSKSNNAEHGEVTIPKIQALLAAKDDTQRFVGLALLKSVLDNSPSIREDQHVLQSLWTSISPRFLDRLLRTGSKSSSSSSTSSSSSAPGATNAKEMLDLAVSILHTFALLLPKTSLEQTRFTARIPVLVAAALHSSPETTQLLLQLLQTLASSREGAMALLEVEDMSPLIEMASTRAIVLDILNFAWLNAMTTVEDKPALAKRIDQTIQSLVSAFKGTDAVTLLAFIGDFFRRADSEVIPSEPKWLNTVIAHIQQLVVSRPTPEARAAYTTATASLLHVYPDQVSKMLFDSREKDGKPLSFLLVNLLLIDIRSSTPVLLEKLNQPDYPQMATRLASAFDTISIFIGHLVRSLEDEELEAMIMSPDNLLKLRKSISETMSVTIEYLRDRWDASVAGVMGLHPDARLGAAETSMGSHHTLAWDSMQDRADEDPLMLSAIRALAIWLREDDNTLLRREATGLTDLFIDLYKSSASEKLDFRSSILVAFEALVTLEEGRELILKEEGWEALTADLAAALQQTSQENNESDASRGIEVVRIMLSIVEQESGGARELWLNLITTVASWDCPGKEQPPLIQEFQVAVLQLCCAILETANPGMRTRYKHSIHAINGVANRLSRTLGDDVALKESIREVLGSLANIDKGRP